jgi:hypothetical protein
MVHYDDNFEPYWLDEKDWLVEVIMLPKDQDLSADLEYMGKLLAFSLITNTQMIAQIGDPNEDILAYELCSPSPAQRTSRDFWTWCVKTGTPILMNPRL